MFIEMNDVKINNNLVIPNSDFIFDYFRASGSGGQHVNKVETGVRLRFNIILSQNLSNDQKKRLLKLFPNQINQSGELLIESTIYKSQYRNKMEVINKFTDLLIRGIKKKKKRKKTSPTKSSIEKRLLKKKKRSSIKNLRKKPSLDEH